MVRTSGILLHRRQALGELPIIAEDFGVVIRAVWSSVADRAIAPLQDVLGLGSEARMNLPNSTNGNWAWR